MSCPQTTTPKPKVAHRIYLIDGVAVPKSVWYRRQIFGENKSSVFSHLDVQSQK